MVKSQKTEYENLGQRKPKKNKIMFVSSTKKGATLMNVAILFAVVVAGALVASMLIHIKPDPKDTGSFRNTLALKKK